VRVVLGFGAGVGLDDRASTDCTYPLRTNDGGQRVVCTFGALAAGETATIDIAATTATDATGTVESWALASVSPEFDRDPDDDKATVSVQVTG
jgi:hypothetical protein